MRGKTIRRRAWTPVLFVGAGLAAFAGDGNFIPTPAEAAGYREYTRNESVAAFLSELAARAPALRVSAVGRSLPTEACGAMDLFLAVLAEKPAAAPAELDRTKPTVLITAAQHGNEQSAKEAALRLVRDLAAGELSPLLERLNVLVMPQTNPCGNLRNVRGNELGLDMNRDHVKLETEGVRAIHRVFRDWMPEVTIDVHEKGDDYYRISIGCVSNANIDAGLQDFSRNTLLAETGRALEKRKVTFHEYLVTEELGVDTSSGSARAAERPAAREEMKRYSTTDLNDGRNSLGIFETLSFIQEGASRHDLETLQPRTDWQYDGLRAFLESAAGHAPEILELVRSRRARLLERAAGRLPGDDVRLRMKYVRDPAVPELRLKRFDREGPPVRGVLRVDKKAGEAVTFADLLPPGYLFEGGRPEIAETLRALGVEVGMFARDVLVEAEVYEVESIIPARFDYDPPERIDVAAKAARLPVRKGDFYVSCVQPAAHLVPCLLEPQSDYGFIRYGKFKLIPEAGGLYEIRRYAGKEDLPVVPYRPWRP
ncbi:MAG: Zinc carboxypeptidase [Candidatus Aminicenantes bacterium ADurb.Bin147]|nr:MAG: Zinc carboxypeptidase [Candidatus Aminicenantes bacterium ADurb.Bin147]